MLHVHYFITRKPSMNDAEFHRYWRETHGPIAARIPQLHRYVQSHRITAYGSNSPYDGEAEVLIDDLDAMAALRRSPEYIDGALADERKFIDLTRVEWMVDARPRGARRADRRQAGQGRVATRDQAGDGARGFPQVLARSARADGAQAAGPAPLRAVASDRRGLPLCHAALRRRRAVMVRQPRGVRRGLCVAGRQRPARGWRQVYRRTRK